MQNAYLQKWDAVVLFFVSLILFTVGLAHQEIIGFEARFYLFALEMWRHGVSLFPTTYHQPYPDYPATATLLIYGFAKLFGHLNKLIAVLPSAIASALTISVTYLIGARQYRLQGFVAAIFLFFTLTFVAEARTISLDQYVTLFTVLSFYIVFDEGNLAWLALFFILSFAFRGPLGLIIPAGVACVFYLIERNFSRFFKVGFLALGLLLFCTVCLLVLANYQGGWSFVQDVWRMQFFGRMSDVSNPPFTFYLTEMWGGYFITYPLAILIVLGSIFSLWKNKQEPAVFLKKLLGWMLVLLIGLSIPGDKKMRYILPIAPALALMCAYWFSEKRNLFLENLRIALLGICLVFPLIGMFVLLMIHGRYELNLPYFNLLIALSVIQVILFLFRKNALAILGLAAFTFFLGNIFIVEKINLLSNRTKSFVLQTENFRLINHSPLVFFQEGPDGLPIKYLVNMPQEAKPVFLYDPNELTSLKPRTIVVIETSNLLKLSAKIRSQFKGLLQSQIGHDNVIVMQKI